MMSTRRIEHALRCIRGEYRETPGLMLTVQQAQELWSLDATVCKLALDALVDSRFLRQMPDGRYVLAMTGDPS